MLSTPICEFSAAKAGQSLHPKTSHITLMQRTDEYNHRQSGEWTFISLVEV